MRNVFIVIRGFRYSFLKRLANAQNLGKPLLVDVRFTVTRYPFFVQHRAFDLLKTSTIDNKLFPEARNCDIGPKLLTVKALEEIEFINPDIRGNEEQKQAVLNILNGTSQPAPYIIFGPPGTGKTVTFVEAILQVSIAIRPISSIKIYCLTADFELFQVKNKIPDSHILVCAQGNSACDYITMKLLQSGGCRNDEILRLNSSARMEDVPREIFHVANSVII